MGTDIHTLAVITPDNESHAEAVGAMAQGAALHDTNCVRDYRKADATLMYGLADPENRKIFGRNQAVGRPTLILGYGFIERDHYHAAGWNGINGYADYRNEAMRADRWGSLKIPMLPWRLDGRHVLLCGQVPNDPNTFGTDINLWCVDTARRIREHTDREIVFRPHPLVNDPPKIPGTTLSVGRTMAEDIEDAWAVVVWNSKASSMTVIDGIPLFACNRGCIAWLVANKEIEQIDRPFLHHRMQWAYNLAYCQWSIEEMASGEVWAHLMR